MESIPPLPQPTTPKTSSLAIWSLVLGCLALVLMVICIGPLFALPAVICGHMAWKRIRSSGGLLSGQGLALAGLITGYISIGLSLLIIPLLVSISLPNFMKARQGVQVNVCIDNLRRIDRAKQTCAMEKKLSADDTPSADDLRPYLGQSFDTLKCPLGGTYSINRIGDPPSCTVLQHVLPSNSRR
jgi:hypothetical protein